MAIRRRKIQALVDRLLHEHGVSSPPVPVDRMIQALGIRLHVDALQGDICGFAFRDSHQSVIGVNTWHPPVRQRFTMAHELGHLLLHDHNFNHVHVDRGFVLKLRNGISSQGIDQEEVEANRFAAELLMPKRFLEKDITALSGIDLLDDTNISALAKRYGVSKQALLIRLASLGFIESAG